MFDITVCQRPYQKLLGQRRAYGRRNGILHMAALALRRREPSANTRTPLRKDWHGTIKKFPAQDLDSLGPCNCKGLELAKELQARWNLLDQPPALDLPVSRTSRRGSSNCWAQTPTKTFQILAGNMRCCFTGFVNIHTNFEATCSILSAKAAKATILCPQRHLPEVDSCCCA
jgi:hypothetical protein